MKNKRMSIPYITPPIYATRSKTLQQLRIYMVVLSDLQIVTQVFGSPLAMGMSVMMFPSEVPVLSAFKLKGRMLLSLVMLLESIWQEVWDVGDLLMEKRFLLREQTQGEDELPRLTVELTEKNSTQPQVSTLQEEGQAKRNWMFLQRSLVRFEPPIWKQELAGRQERELLVHCRILPIFPGSIPKWSSVQFSGLRGTLDRVRLELLQSPEYSLRKASQVILLLGQLTVSRLTLNPTMKGEQLGSERLVLKVVSVGSQLQLIWELVITMPQLTICTIFSTSRMTMRARRGMETMPPQTLLQLRSPFDFQKLLKEKMLDWRIRALIIFGLKVVIIATK